MGYVVFENDGEIDPRSISTFGVSVKENENPIGYFGTGLKYAISILLRNNHSVSVYAGDQAHEFALKEVTIRGKAFNLITMNGVELPITTELGKNWDIWQAFREIYCNCMDENGTTSHTYLKPSPKPGKTLFVIKGHEFKKAFDDRNNIVLSLDKSMNLVGGGVEVYDQPSKFLYYRSVRVLTLSHPALFTYNIIDDLELTEDRTIKYESAAVDKLPRALARLKDKALIRKAILSHPEAFESGFNFDRLCHWMEIVSDEFKETIEYEYNLNNDKMNRTAISLHKHIVNKAASKNYQPIELTLIEKLQADKCVRLAKQLYEDFSDYQILYVKTLGQNTMALADQNERRMIISRNCFERGTKYLLATMLEEYAHLKTGHGDHTRELQTWLFDNICSLAEVHVFKEPI